MVWLDPVAVAAEFSARQILSLIMLPFSSADEKILVGDNEFSEKNGKGWSGHDVELHPVAVAVESLARQVSVMLMQFSSTEEKI